MVPHDVPATTATRRAVLGAAVLVAGATSGCAQRTRSLLDRGTTEQVSLGIKTVPSDSDRTATRIARSLADNLVAAGVDAEVVLESEDELRRSVLINHDYDVYVAQFPDRQDPDFLRPLLHSVFVEEPGWQNPFGFADLDVDALLEEQRSTRGSSRRDAVAEVLRAIARQQPFVVVAYPNEVRAVRSDRWTGWDEVGLRSPLGYLAIRHPNQEATATDGSDDAGGDGQFRVTITDRQVTENFNPIAVEFRGPGTFTGLLYDPLARRYEGRLVPWLAESLSWETTRGETVATVRLRADLAWHDGRLVSANDVAFTYAFLDDTMLGEGSSQAPAPRFRGRVSLVDSVTALDDRRLRFTFGDAPPAVAGRALTVPVLPEHEWRPKSVEANIAGLDLFDGVTEALVWDNPAPVGSGALRFERAIPEEAIVLSRFDDHFLARGDRPDEWAGGGVAFEELFVRVAPSDTAAVELVAVDEADATASSLDPLVVPRIGRNDDLQLVVTPSRSFYHVGFNARRDPLGNPRFRQAVARLLDKRTIADEVFDGYAQPSASPLTGTGWTPSDLRWEGEDPSAPFVDAGGELDEAAARELFRDIGYRYSEDGKLLRR